MGRCLSAVFMDAALTVALTAMLDTITTLFNLTENLTTTMQAFQELRDKTDQDEWDQLCDHPLVGPLLDSLSDLEYTLAK